MYVVKLLIVRKTTKISGKQEIVFIRYISKDHTIYIETTCMTFSSALKKMFSDILSNQLNLYYISIVKECIN